MVDEATTITDTARPRLPHGVRLTYSEGQGSWVLLAPERVFRTNAITVEILRRCTGELTVNSIIEDLSKSFADAPRDRIRADVIALLQSLAGKRLLELR